MSSDVAQPFNQASPPAEATDGGPSGLTVADISVKFSGMTAVDLLSVTIPDEGRTAVIGPNGAGKSTLLKAIVGEERTTSGSIRFRGKRIDRLDTVARARLGIIRTRQELGLYWSMTAWENIVCGADNPAARSKADRSRSRRRPWGRKDSFVEHLIDLLDLQSWRDGLPGTLPYGVRKRVELARALAARPRVLMLDEPVAGLNTREKATMVEYLDRLLLDFNMALLLIEHDMQTVSALCPRDVHAMVDGRIVASGAFDRVITDDLVVASYFGTRQNAATQRSAASD